MKTKRTNVSLFSQKHRGATSETIYETLILPNSGDSPSQDLIDTPNTSNVRNVLTILQQNLGLVEFEKKFAKRLKRKKRRLKLS